MPGSTVTEDLAALCVAVEFHVVFGEEFVEDGDADSFDSLKAQLQIVLEHQQGANAIDSEEGWLRTGLITLVKERILALKKIYVQKQ